MAILSRLNDATTSTLVAILDQEPEADRIARAIAAPADRMLAAANLVEAGMVMQARRDDEGSRNLCSLHGQTSRDRSQSLSTLNHDG